MPIYEYECEDCCHCFEKLVFGGEADETVCPACCSEKVKRLMSAACVVAAGDGGTCSPRVASKGFS